MKYIQTLIFLFNLFQLVCPTWHFTTHRTCHPGGNGRNNLEVPFTGFKITRQYKISGGILPVSMHFLTLSHCDHGRLDYQKTIRTDSSGYVDWEKPFCMLKPKLGEMLTLPFHDTINEHSRELKEEDVDTYDDFPGFFQVKLKKVKNLIRKKVDIQMEKFTNGKFLQYTGKNKFFHHQDLLSSDPQSSLEWESRNLVCYKMARRKKYAKRRISFYVPYTFVGGLFECYIPPAKKREIFTKYTSTDFFIQSFDFKCEPQLSRPISPLLAEDSTTQWFENKLFNLFNPGIIQTIPYLTTSTPLNLRFSSLETSDMYRDTWATKIDVNEDYVYKEADLHIISQAIAKSADLLNKIIAPIDFNKLLKAYNRANEREHPQAKSVLEYKPEDVEVFLSKASFDQKLGFWLSYLDEKLSSWYLQEIEKFWSRIS
ncbi:hypothetical protein JA1_001993 [Spathaspora sp. JA1]|nr:hypothetical protein JA1_001993 [Spathaspora sp. JA1]